MFEWVKELFAGPVKRSYGEFKPITQKAKLDLHYDPLSVEEDGCCFPIREKTGVHPYEQLTKNRWVFDAVSLCDPFSVCNVQLPYLPRTYPTSDKRENFEISCTNVVGDNLNERVHGLLKETSFLQCEVMLSLLDSDGNKTETWTFIDVRVEGFQASSLDYANSTSFLTTVQLSFRKLEIS